MVLYHHVQVGRCTRVYETLKSAGGYGIVPYRTIYVCPICKRACSGFYETFTSAKQVVWYGTIVNNNIYCMVWYHTTIQHSMADPVIEHMSLHQHMPPLICMDKGCGCNQPNPNPNPNPPTAAAIARMKEIL